MTVPEAVERVRAAFAGVSRPETFVRHPNHCCECFEHEETLAAHTPETITLEELGHPAWDPICFAGDAAFAWYLPAMVRLALETDAYEDQLLFHLNVPGRVDSLTPRQASALLDALWVLADIKGDGIAGTLELYRLEEAMRRLETASPDSRREDGLTQGDETVAGL